MNLLVYKYMKNKEKIIELIMNSNNYMEVLSIFCYFSKILDNTIVLIADNDNGVALPEMILSRKIGKGKVLNFFGTRKFIIINNTMVNNLCMDKGTDFLFDCCVSLDTNAVSYLKQIANGKMSEYRSLIEFLNRKDINFDCNLYLQENCGKIDQGNYFDIYENLKTFINLTTIDFELYEKYGVISSKYGDSFTNTRTDELFTTMRYLDSDIFENDKYLWKLKYALLLKMSIIEITSKKSPKNKMIELLKFSAEELSILLARDLTIIGKFFWRDIKVQSFFRKIKPNAKNIIEIIKAMTWDLFHLFKLEYTLIALKSNSECIPLLSILTYDNGLKDIIEAYTYKMVILSDRFYGVPECGIDTFLLTKGINISEFYNFEKLEKRRDHVIKIDDLINKLENDLLQFMS